MEDTTKLFTGTHILLLDMPMSEGESLQQVVTRHGGVADIQAEVGDNSATHIVPSAHCLNSDRYAAQLDEESQKGKYVLTIF